MRAKRPARMRRRIRAWLDDAMGWQPPEPDDVEDFSVLGGNLGECTDARGRR